MKHSFYPSEDIEAKLREEAVRTHRTIRKTINDIVEAYYNAKEQECDIPSSPLTSKNLEIQPLPPVVMPSGITDILLSYGLRYEDNRPKAGKVWVYDTPGAEGILRQLEKRFPVRFVYIEHGGNATGGKSAWYMK